jgi:Trypsin-like peptidase domain
LRTSHLITWRRPDNNVPRHAQHLLRRALNLGVLLVVAFPTLPSWADGPEDSLRIYAVNIHQTPMQTWGPGYGIYLGKGLFITAAHVAGRTWLTRPKVTIAGREYPTRVVKEGSLETVDLTLLVVDENLLPVWLRLRRNELCKQFPLPGEQVVTVIPEGVVRSSILAPERLPASVRKFNSVIADVAKTGNSGSGVFDAQSKCLLGIMSRKISQSLTQRGTNRTVTRDIAKYFVPSTTIREFIPPDSAF